MTRTARWGAVLVALYLLAAAATTGWAPGRLRPLFDGFGSHPGQYNWVNPPREFAEGNQRPEPSEGEIRFDTVGSEPVSTGPNDGQALVALEPGIVAPHPPDASAKVTLTPVDPGKLGSLPAGLRPEGNAYRIEITYASGLKVVALEKPGTVGLTSAAPADTLLYSRDGQAWQALGGELLPTNNGLTGPLAATGYYLAAAKGAPRQAGGGGGSGSAGTVALVVAIAAVPVALAWLLLARRRQAQGVRGRPGTGRDRPGGGRPKPGAPGGRAAGTGGRPPSGRQGPPRRRGRR
ncbi:MAG TPA: hypothetical protein VHM89_04925 [Acidimicrobiales bacterium]|nr:hypothetical protein [Acidimicrobiales bacterium]